MSIPASAPKAPMGQALAFLLVPVPAKEEAPPCRGLTFSAMGIGGHTVVTFEKDVILVKYHKTSPSERGMIEQFVEKALAKGLKLHRSKKGEAGEPLDAIVDVIMDPKGEVALKGPKEAVDELAVAVVEKEIKDGRLVMEAQEDGTWKILHLGDFKKKDKEQEVVSQSKAGGG